MMKYEFQQLHKVVFMIKIIKIQNIHILKIQQQIITKKKCKTIHDEVDDFILHINEFINKSKLLKYMESKANNEVIE